MAVYRLLVESDDGVEELGDMGTFTSETTLKQWAEENAGTLVDDYSEEVS